MVDDTDCIYYASDTSFRRAIYQFYCDPDGPRWLPSWVANNHHPSAIADLMAAEMYRMYISRHITEHGKILDKGYKECQNMCINVPMDAMA